LSSSVAYATAGVVSAATPGAGSRVRPSSAVAAAARERGDGDRDGEGGLVTVGERRRAVGSVRAGHGDRGQDRHAHRTADLERRVVRPDASPPSVSATPVSDAVEPAT
jgi:hypothetical protein